MNIRLHLLILMVFCVLLNSCEQVQIEDFESKTPVVEAFLYAGQNVDSIKVTQSYSYGQQDTNIITLDDLDLFLTKDGTAFPLKPQGNGIYENSDLQIEYDASYLLTFDWNGEKISAETYIPQKKEAYISTAEIQMEKINSGTIGGGFGGGGFGNMPDPIEITWDNTEGDYYYVVFKNIEEDPEYINELIREFDVGNGGPRRFLLISEPQITDFYTIDPRRELTQFGTYEIVVFRVNPEYAALYESSGNSSLSLEQPPTNIENGLGIFTGVSSDTLYLEVVEQ